MGTPSDEKKVESNNKASSGLSDKVGRKDGRKPTEEGELYEDELDSIKGEEEDIPDDFFDDFSNEDFMDGLDIVDAWNETQKNRKVKEQKERDENQRQRKRSREHRSPERRPRSAQRDKRRRSEERRRRSRERQNKEDSPPRKRNAEESELRRDPSKTKRDLEKDRENYVKKKEQKFISKVVETGLVPPGMETEVDLSQIQGNAKTNKEEKRKDKLKKEPAKHEEYRPNLGSGSRDRSRERRKRRSRSFDRLSPLFRGRNSRGRSGERRRERSRGRRDDRSRERRGERSRERLRRTRSPERREPRIIDLDPFSPSDYRRRRSRSISDRERWLNTRRSHSPERKYRERLGEEKMSFLEELKMKLDGHPSNHPNNFPFRPNSVQRNVPPGPGPNVYVAPSIPVLAPAPNQYFPANANSSYDQNFFIGDPQPVPPINHGPQQMSPHMPAVPPPLPMGMPPTGGMRMSPHDGGRGMPPPSVGISPTYGGSQPIRHQPVVPVPPPNLNNAGSVTAAGMNSVAKLMEQIRANTGAKVNPTGNTAQLLEQNKLSLTDFLSFNSRPQAFSSSPDTLQKKVTVLSRCQDILKELTGDKKFGGKLIVKKPNLNKSEPNYKNVSPLLRKEPVRFSYSTNSKNSEVSSFQHILNKALVKTGVISEVIELDEVEESVPPAPPVSKRKNLPFSIGSKSSEPLVSKRVLMKMCQTDPIECEDCEIRKSIQYKSIGIQCGESERYNVGVQVVEMDIMNSKIPKNQSLAYLTPAQLLGRGEPTSTKVDNFARPAAPSMAYRDYRDWPRGYIDSGTRRLDYLPSPPSRDPRYSRF